MSGTLMISVSGMRGHVGTDLTPELVARHAAALGAWARRAGTSARGARPGRPHQRPDVRAGGRRRADVRGCRRDRSRAWSPRRRRSSRSSTTTPAPGLILTASHNPIEWNALKLVGPDGIFLDAEAGAAVRALADAGPARAGWDGIGTRARAIPDAVARHLDAVLALPVIDVAAIRGATLSCGARLCSGRRRCRDSATARAARRPGERHPSGARRSLSPSPGAGPREPRRPRPACAGERRRSRPRGGSRRGSTGAGGRNRRCRSARTTRWPWRCGRCSRRRAGGRAGRRAVTARPPWWSIFLPAWSWRTRRGITARGSSAPRSARRTWPARSATSGR